ncbi:hypothetical protein [Flagellimonas amoyensis]|uniref:hypothetical protein n=1 Tax=Flagellimonas amoyensis TaxID=2169401 RepID=UPI000D349F5E|nr:hypothetical protein [Allomuricauda amoyensis]
MVLQLKDTIGEILGRTIDEAIETKTIFLVGSSTQSNLKSFKGKQSDVDILILNNSLTGQISNVDNGLRYDISIIKDDIIGLLISAFHGNKTAGKVFSSMNAFQIIDDNDGKGDVFASNVNKLYKIFTNSSLPNFIANSIFLHNIKVNLDDIAGENDIDSHFAHQRFSNHLLDYVASLVYPFRIEGKYRGKIFRQNIEGFDRFLEEIKGSSHGHFLATKFFNRFVPILECEYYGLEYSLELKKEIVSGNIKSFYFGYDSIVSEKTILFLPGEEWSKYSNKRTFKHTGISNIVPCLSIEQHDFYIQILTTVSKLFFPSKLNERKNALIFIFKLFHGSGLGEGINGTIRAGVVLKSVISLSQTNLEVDSIKFKDWLDNTAVSFSKNKPNNTIDASMEESIQTLTNFIDGFESHREKEIIASYSFFGIMKALRIRIEDLEF